MKPIIFSTAMVQAILAGNKTQTRRVVTRKGYDEKIHRHKNDYAHNDIDNLWQFGYRAENRGWPQDSVGVFSRYQPGDILWVRETWRMYEKAVGNGENFHVERFFAYKADEDNPAVKKCSEWYDNIKLLGGGLYQKYKTGSWRPSIFMPKEAARIFLRVTNVRTERVQDMSANDALAEGMKGEYVVGGSFCPEIGEFKALWDNLNAKRGYKWDANPWVWVYEFEQIEKPEQEEYK